MCYSKQPRVDLNHRGPLHLKAINLPKTSDTATDQAAFQGGSPTQA